jgi:hypothetical protein
LYACTFNPEADVFTLFDAVPPDKTKDFTVREIAEAKDVKILAQKLGYPSPATMIDMINSGSIVDCPVSSAAIRNAYHMFDPDLA